MLESVLCPIAIDTASWDAKRHNESKWQVLTGSIRTDIDQTLFGRDDGSVAREPPGERTPSYGRSR